MARWQLENRAGKLGAVPTAGTPRYLTCLVPGQNSIPKGNPELLVGGVSAVEAPWHFPSSASLSLHAHSPSSMEALESRLGCQRLLLLLPPW